MDRHFACTQCGLCCTGQLPLTLDEAIARADRFPLALVWTPIRQGAKAFDMVRRFGFEIRLGRRRVAVVVTAMAYLPPGLRCPEQGPDGRCAVHDDKPLRCRTMPLSALVPDEAQAQALVPRPGWACDTQATAPVIYRDRAVVDPTDLERERAALAAQAPVLEAYARRRLAVAPTLLGDLARAEAHPQGGRLALPFTGLLPRLAVDPHAFARRQTQALTHTLSRIRDQGDEAPFHRFYREVLDALSRS